MDCSITGFSRNDELPEEFTIKEFVVSVMEMSFFIRFDLFTFKFIISDRALIVFLYLDERLNPWDYL